MHPFISTEANASEKYAADRQLDVNGKPVCDYRPEFVGTLTNEYGKQLLAFITLAMDELGFSGIYLDESSYGVTPLDYSPLHDDGHSAIINAKTLQIEKHVSFVPLTWGALQVKLYDEVVAKRGGVMIANSMPLTRTVMQGAIHNSVVQFIESASKGRESWGQAFTPVGLSKALFQLTDTDPSYANVSGLPVDNLYADLDFGTLTYFYDTLLPNVSGWRTNANVMQAIFPTTVVELGSGFIVGKERVVSKVARDFAFGAAKQALRLRYFDRQGWLTHTARVEGPTVRVKTDGGGARSFAVIDHAPKESAALKVDDDELRIWPQPLLARYGNGTLFVRSLTGAEPAAVTRDHGLVLTRALRQFGSRTNLDCSSFRIAVADESEELVDMVDERYDLNVTDEDGVSIAARTVFGAKHALDSLAQLVVGNGVRHVTLKDEPQHGYRGLMISPGQRFMTMELLKHHLDAMEIARLNVLHFHLSEFCRYAIESKAYPQLSKNLSSGLNKGFYTWPEITTLIARAKLRGIRVIPEYDVPGHQGRNIGLIEKLQWCSARPPASSDYQWELFDDPAGKTFSVLSTLITELISLFPDKYFHIGGDEIKAVGPCTVNGSLFGLEQKVLALLKTHSKTGQGWSELLLATDGTKGFPNTAINAWQGTPLYKCTGVTCGSAANITARDHQVIVSNSSVYYLGWNPISFDEIYIDIAEGIPPAQRYLLLGGEVSVWTDHYTAPTFGKQCGVDSGPQTNQAKALFPRSEDAAFAQSALGVTFPGAVIAADSWWRFDASLLGKKAQASSAYRKRLAKINARLIAAGVDSCPTECMWKPHAGAGCNETHRCGKPYLAPLLLKADDDAALLFCTSATNDLFLAAAKAAASAAPAIRVARFSNCSEAVQLGASTGAGVLLLADGGASSFTTVTPAMLKLMGAFKFRLFAESAVVAEEGKRGLAARKCPPYSRFVAMSGSALWSASDLDTTLQPLDVLEPNNCLMVPPFGYAPAATHATITKVAGFDRAVFGVNASTDKPLPLLSQPRNHPGALFSTSALSSVVRSRFSPVQSWARLWRGLLRWLVFAEKKDKLWSDSLEFTLAVRPAFARSAALPATATKDAVLNGMRWLHSTSSLLMPNKAAGATTSALLEQGVLNPRSQGWPLALPLPLPASAYAEDADGSSGIVEAFLSAIQPARGTASATQQVCLRIRTDCVAESAGALAIGALAQFKDDRAASVAENLLDHLFGVGQDGPRSDPRNPLGGILKWGTNMLAPQAEEVYSDDQARSMLAVAFGVSLFTSAGRPTAASWDTELAKLMLGNARLMNRRGMSKWAGGQQSVLVAEGWRASWDDDTYQSETQYYQSVLRATNLWSFAVAKNSSLFLDRTVRGINASMASFYAKTWTCQVGLTPELAKTLLPLAWLVRVNNTVLSRKWLRDVADALISHMDSVSGAVIEDPAGQDGVQCGHHPPTSNAAYGTQESTLSQSSNDSVADLLYSTNFAVLAMHEAAAATQDAAYIKAAKQLADFAVRAQVGTAESGGHLRGAWLRALDLKRWDYYASGSDTGWGPWVAETGHGGTGIMMALAVREMNTSVWEVLTEPRFAERIGKRANTLAPEFMQ